MEELVELEDLTYDLDTAIREVVMVAGFILVAYERFLAGQDNQARAEFWRELKDWLYPSVEKAHRDFVEAGYHKDTDYDKGEQHPDVCLSCYHYFGETVGGRLRFNCYRCRHDSSIPKSRPWGAMEMNRICPCPALQTQIFGRLIRDYYSQVSPRGLAKWIEAEANTEAGVD